MLQNTSMQGGIPIEEIELGTGRLIDAATKEGVQLIPDESDIPRISYNEVARQLDVANVISTAHNGGREVDASELVGKKFDIEGARCVLAIEQNGKRIMFPAAAINMGPHDSRLGFVVLDTFVDRRDPLNPDSKFAQFSALQQQLLDTYVIHARQDTGLSHGDNGLVNAGEIGHGALVASMSRDDVNIHQITHKYGARRQISQLVSSEASGIYAKNEKPRPTGNRVMYVRGAQENRTPGAPTIEKIYFGTANQLDQALGLNAYGAAVGMVAAVVRTAELTEADVPRVDLLANMGRIVTPLALEHETPGGLPHAH